MVTGSMGKFEELCGKVLRSLPLTCRWFWDEDYDVARTTFSKALVAPVLNALSSHFDNEWDFTTINNASRPVADFFRSSLGLFPGQRAFTVDHGSGLTLFALWWPWGDGAKVSLRIGVFADDGSDMDASWVQEHLMRWFAI